MTPPQLHMHLEVLFNAGILPINTVGLPGAQGAAVTGTQGMGVSTPSAAAVADATVGLAMELHMPNGMMLTIGLLSMMLAAGLVAIVRLAGKTISVPGARPKLHCRLAPLHTSCPIEIISTSFALILLFLTASYNNISPKSDKYILGKRS